MTIPLNNITRTFLNNMFKEHLNLNKERLFLKKNYLTLKAITKTLPKPGNKESTT